MISLAVSRKIAQALWGAADSNKKRKNYLDFLLKMSAILENTDLQSIMKTPAISVMDKYQILLKLEASMSVAELKNFMIMLINRRQCIYLSKIKDSYYRMYMTSNNILLVKLTLAHKTSKKDIRKIVNYIENETGKKVELESEVDPSLLAGLTIEYADNFIDNSLKKRMSVLAHSMSRN